MKKSLMIDDGSFYWERRPHLDYSNSKKENRFITAIKSFFRTLFGKD